MALIVAVQTNDVSAAALLKIQKVGSMIQPLITGDRGWALEGFHSITVQLRDAGKRAVAARQGYWAISSP
jgi:hypothetical protein